MAEKETLTPPAGDATLPLGGYPTTIVDEAGYPLGLLYGGGGMVAVAPSRVGSSIQVEDDDHQVYEYEVMWDGARPAASGRTKGELLGPYATTGALWRRIAQGSAGIARRRKRHQRLDENQPSEQ